MTREIRFQRQGYADAITDPLVLSAIAGNAHGKIAITYVEWGNATSQDVVVDWSVIDGAPSAAAFAGALMAAPRRAYGRNAIGSALLRGKSLIESNDITGVRRVIDLSADSANTWSGPPLETARAEVVASGIIINGWPSCAGTVPAARCPMTWNRPLPTGSSADPAPLS